MARTTKNISEKNTELFRVVITRSYEKWDQQTVTRTDIYGPYEAIGTAKGVASLQTNPYNHYTKPSGFDVRIERTDTNWERVPVYKEATHG